MTNQPWEDPFFVVSRVVSSRVLFMSLPHRSREPELARRSPVIGFGTSAGRDCSGGSRHPWQGYAPGRCGRPCLGSGQAEQAEQAEQVRFKEANCVVGFWEFFQKVR